MLEKKYNLWIALWTHWKCSEMCVYTEREALQWLQDRIEQRRLKVWPSSTRFCIEKL